MAKFTRDERRAVIALVNDCIIRHYREKEALRYIKDGMKGRGISDRMYRKYIAKIKSNTEQRVNILKREEFVFEAMQRIDEVKENYRRLTNLRTEAEGIEDDYKRVTALANIEEQLSSLTMRLAELYDAMPFVSAVQVKLKREVDQENAKISKPA